MYSLQRFSHILWNSCFTQLIISIAMQKLFSSVMSCSSNVGLSSWENRTPLRRSFPTPVSYSPLLRFSSGGFSVSAFMFRSLIHLKLHLVQSDRYRTDFMLLNVDIQFSQHDSLKILSFLKGIFGIVKYQKVEVACTCFGSLILSYWSSSLFLCQYHIVFITVAL